MISWNDREADKSGKPSQVQQQALRVAARWLQGQPPAWGSRSLIATSQSMMAASSVSATGAL